MAQNSSFKLGVFDDNMSMLLTNIRQTEQYRLIRFNWIIKR